MSDESVLPFLSRFDPPQQAEGSLDPLGLYAVADALGVKLAEGVRERMSRPRYLTLALIGMVVCGDEVVRAGEHARLPAWLVYEWTIVESLVRQLRGSADLHGIPGRDKVLACLDASDVVCARTYLKTPTVFGFHGIYRVLGTKTGLFDADGHPLARGYSVLQAWQADQALQGFVDGHGPGSYLRRALERATRSGIEAGHARDPGAEVRRAIADHMRAQAPGLREREVLWQAIAGGDAVRGEVCRWLTSPDGQRAWAAAGGDEARFHAWLTERASPVLRQLLSAIRAYEKVARLLIDAFDEMRWRMTEERRALTVEALGDGEALRRAAADGPVACEQALAELGEIDPKLRMRAEGVFGWLGERNSPRAFASRVLDQHERVQRAKPPNGKRPWFDAFGDGRVAIRPAYTVDSFTHGGERFVHAYRTKPLWSFAFDLGQVSAPITVS